jgi:hypothetical protein|tara:strand:+ start:187 stop:873 length:687 start_codon:yes stop_codon:yes gene_type:complete
MDLLNELQYQFGTKGALSGTATKDSATNKYEPNLFQKALGITSEQLTTAAEEGKFNRFSDTQQGQDAKRYGVTYTRSDMGNLGGLQDRIDDAKALRTGRETLTGLGYKGDTSAYTTPEAVAAAIRTQKRENAIELDTITRRAAFDDPTAADERRIRDQRYYDLQKSNLEERIERREDKATEFEYMKMRDRKADQQYNERMAKLDRKDRILAMQNIAAGLASLGAAFAV